SFPFLRAIWPASSWSGSLAPPRFLFQNAFVTCAALAHGPLVRRWRRFGWQALKQAAITDDIAIMLRERAGKEMSAGIVGDEIEVVRVHRGDNGTQGCVSRIRDRPRRKATMQVRIVRGRNVEILGRYLERGLAREIERVLNRGIALQRHTQFQTIIKNARDHWPLAGLRRFALDKRRQSDELLRRKRRNHGTRGSRG